MNAKKETVQVLFAWAGERNLVICGVVRLELLRGIKALKLLTRISAFTEMLFDVRADNSLWNEATDLAWQLDRKTILIPSADVVIAASAMRLGAAVLTLDAQFSQVAGLRVITPPAEWFGS